MVDIAILRCILHDNSLLQAVCSQFHAIAYGLSLQEMSSPCLGLVYKPAYSTMIKLFLALPYMLSGLRGHS